MDHADERLSSTEAEAQLRSAGNGARKLGEHVDAVAAQLILQTYFADMTSPGHDPLLTEPGHADDRPTDTLSR